MRNALDAAGALAKHNAAPPVPPVAPVGYTPGQVAASLAANPQASKGGYEGVGTPAIPGPAGQTSYATSQPLVTTVDPYDYSQDPILNKIKANTDRARSDARAAALAQQTAEHIRFDDRTNPFSTLNQIDKTYGDTTHNHEETLNQQNLWYSGAHAKQLADDANAYQHDLYDARGQDQQNLTGINSALAAALYGYDQQDMQAESDAAGRASTRAQTYGYDPGTAAATDASNAKDAAAATASLPAALANPTYSVPINQSGGFSSLTTPPRPSAPAGSPAATRQPPAAPKPLKNPYLTNPNKRG